VKSESIHEKLIEPFEKDEIEFRLAQCGKTKNGAIWAQCLAYITSRAIMDRLDKVCGPDKWRVSYDFIGDKGVLCSLSIKFGDEWITKQDGADMTDIEAFKGGISSAIKRAGSAWGMGRYLYSLKSGFAKIVEKGTPGALYGQTKEKEGFYWLPEDLPDWALPKKTKADDSGAKTIVVTNKIPEVPNLIRTFTPAKDKIKDDPKTCKHSYMISKYNKDEEYCPKCYSKRAIARDNGHQAHAQEDIPF